MGAPRATRSVTHIEFLHTQKKCVCVAPSATNDCQCNFGCAACHTFYFTYLEIRYRNRHPILSHRLSVKKPTFLSRTEYYVLSRTSKKISYYFNSMNYHHRSDGFTAYTQRILTEVTCLNRSHHLLTRDKEQPIYSRYLISEFGIAIQSRLGPKSVGADLVFLSYLKIIP